MAFSFSLASILLSKGARKVLLVLGKKCLPPRSYARAILCRVGRVRLFFLFFRLLLEVIGAAIKFRFWSSMVASIPLANLVE